MDYQDFYGDGPSAPTGGAEAFGDPSSIAVQGTVTYDVADFANPAVVSFPGGHCYIRIVGVAPGANVVALKAGWPPFPAARRVDRPVRRRPAPQRLNTFAERRGVLDVPAERGDQAVTDQLQGVFRPGLRAQQRDDRHAVASVYRPPPP